MALQVKICGITTIEAGEAAARARADFVGLNCHPASPRHVAPHQAQAIANRLRGSIRIVVVLVDPIDEHIGQVIQATRPDYLQLHGNETPERVLDIRARFGIPILKAISVADVSDLVRVGDYEKAADQLLFDTKAPEGAAYPGGTGAAFDWQLLRGRTFRHRWLLAGGLNAGNVARAIQASGAPGVDASSGVETAPGVKSVEMIRDFVAAARGAQFAAGTNTNGAGA